MRKKRISRSVIIHKIKTGIYAVAAVVLVGWVTDALNEDLMFRLVTRHFFPDAVASYSHPFESLTSTLIWGIPLIVGLSLMFIASILTVHHFKKKHIYSLNKAKHLRHVESVILYTSPQLLPEALSIYATAKHFHILATTDDQPAIIEITEKILNASNQTFTFHPFTMTEDLHTAAMRLNKFLHAVTSIAEDDSLLFDIKYCPALIGSAAMYCSLETEFTLAYPTKETIQEYSTECIIEE